MHPKIRERIEAEIAVIEKSIANAPYIRHSLEDPFVKACVQNLADRKNLSFADAVEPFVKQHLAMARWRLGHLRKSLDMAVSKNALD